MAVKTKDTKKPVKSIVKVENKKLKKQPESQAATTIFRVVCLIGAIALLFLDATITTFDYPVWVLGLLMGVVIGLGPDDLREWFKGRGK